MKRATGAIGYAERNYAKQEDLSVASIQNRVRNYVEPSVAGAPAALDSFRADIAKDVRTPVVDAQTSAKEAYPISGVTFVLIPKDGATEVGRRTVRDFVRYAINEGPSATEGLYYAKLPKVGSAQEFIGARILGCFLKNDECGLGDGQALGLGQQLAEILAAAAASQNSLDVAVDGFHHSEAYFGAAVVQDPVQVIQQMRRPYKKEQIRTSHC